jgi:hypothetical protein
MHVNIEMKGVTICSSVVNRRGGLRDAVLEEVMMPNCAEDLYALSIPSVIVSTMDSDDSISTAVLDDDLAVE